MLFSSMTFIFVFLPIVCTVYLLARKELHNYILLIASIIFYAWGEPRYLIIMLLTILVNYVGANCISLSKNTFHRKLCLTATIIADLSFLFYFKYFNFVTENINAVFNSDFTFIHVVLPIGISFYTFQALSYVIDVYRGEVEVQRDIYKLALYICLFPQLVAGPIVKYHDVAEQISDREVTFDKVAYGVKRFIIGLSKKMLIANTLGEVADKVFNQPIEQIDCMISWIGALSYTLQIYYDFSGYSDMAIGLGAIFGFKFLENFNYPFISKSISEYWRRWHISLSSWFRDYMFFPISRALSLSGFSEVLSGKIGRKNTNICLTFLALFVVWYATGLWHGAAWTFVIWGLYNGFFIFIEMVTKWNRERESLWVKFAQHLYTVMVFIISFVIFRSDTMTYAWNYLKRMFGLIGEHTYVYDYAYYINNIVVIAFVVGVMCATPLFHKMLNVSDEKVKTRALINIWLLTLFVVSSMAIAATTYNPFIYFRF